MAPRKKYFYLFHDGAKETNDVKKRLQSEVQNLSVAVEMESNYSTITICGIHILWLRDRGLSRSRLLALVERFKSQPFKK